jgi:hypothetical protein
MGALIKMSINLDAIDKSKLIKGKKGTYANLILSVNDESRFGNNCSIAVDQTKEEREAKTAKTYIGNGSVVWTDGSVVLAEREDDGMAEVNVAEDTEDDLPF